MVVSPKVANLHRIYADPHSSFDLNADSDRNFHFNPDPDPHKNEATLRLLVY
jgi:hypothetical protein